MIAIREPIRANEYLFNQRTLNLQIYIAMLHYQVPFDQTAAINIAIAQLTMKDLFFHRVGNIVLLFEFRKNDRRVSTNHVNPPP